MQVCTVTKSESVSHFLKLKNAVKIYHLVTSVVGRTHVISPLFSFNNGQYTGVRLGVFLRSMSGYRCLALPLIANYRRGNFAEGCAPRLTSTPLR
jgi:hypothetical protein